ncbi:oxidoreductase [Sphingomonas sp. HDW15A]|uniref:proton-conducting transporter transmembrane domain-containing protein n=1 Tax=Sphingomonas sp. HDW15A TaxID=2714942 RepID=UPI00140840C8|nr:proton-conducting transporter membrane subunit [Sphingomonas sp. HDW15A]QIK95987.1 oxidoreductase [Sphingomonas sp. HDW15A]
MPEFSHSASSVARGHIVAPIQPIRAASVGGGLGLAGIAIATIAGLIAPFAGLIAMLTLLVSTAVLGFSERYLRSDPHQLGFALKVLGIVGATLLFLLADNMIMIAAGWIASGLIMAQLIGHVQGWDEACAARRRALKQFLLGDMALVAALAILALDTGSLSVASPGPNGTAQSAVALLLVLAACVRCALPPFSRWLTRSMAAPTPVSALMHAGFVNAGGVLLVRFGPLLEQAPAAQLVAIAAGSFAALWGTAVMWVRPDVKRSLAGSTVAQMGFMVMSCGLGAYAAAAFHLIAHGLFKAWLFLSSGSAIGRPQIAGVRSPVRSLLLGAVAALAACSLTLWTSGSLPPPTILPSILAVATAAASVPLLFRSGSAIAVGILLLLLYACGVQLMTFALERPVGSPPAGNWLAACLLAMFGTAWLIQHRLLDAGRNLPAFLHARLLNS